MHAITRHLTLLLAAAAIALGAIGPAAGANEFIGGVTDSTTGVLRELERRNDARFVPGVTDSGTGVLREREQRQLEREAPVAMAGDSGFGASPAAIALGAALAVAAAAGAIVLAGSARGRHIPA
jgi:hypothetical protein